MWETEHLLLYVLDYPVRRKEDTSSSDTTVLARGI